MPAPSAAVEPGRFRDIVHGLGAGDTDGLALAVSGGPDSLALLSLGHAAFPKQISVLSVDHRMRPESAGECAHVASLCQTLGVPHATLTVRHPPASQKAAREARYRLMGEWCAAHRVPWLLTAHHQDDQAETFLLRLVRGSGLSGLAAIRPVRPLMDDVRLMRPLLAFPRAMLHETIRHRDWIPADDPSNRDPHYDRTHIRRLLAREDLLDAEKIAEAAHHLQSVEDSLSWLTEELRRTRTEMMPDGTVWLNDEGLPPNLRNLLLLAAFRRHANTKPDLARIAALAGQVARNGKANLAGLLVERQRNGLLKLSPEPARRPCRTPRGKP